MFSSKGKQKEVFDESEDEELPPYNTALPSDLACVALGFTDRLRAFGFSANELSSIRDTVIKSWPKGVQAEKLIHAGFYEFKLKGSPWLGQTAEAIASRVLIRNLLALLYSLGWAPLVATGLTRAENDKDILYFRRLPTLPPAYDWLAISFNEGDKLRLIGADDALIEAVKQTIENQQPGFLQKALWKELNVAYQFKLKGLPWGALTTKASVMTQHFLLNLLSTLAKAGYSLVISLDQSYTSTDTDTWYLKRLDGFQQGMQVY